MSEIQLFNNSLTSEANKPQALAMVSRQAEEVKAAVFMAKSYPRNEHEAYTRIMRSCERKSLAEGAMYEFPRGGQKVTGPSIRLAEEIARNWGNIDSGVVELEQKNGESQVMAYAWDLETNTRQTKVFTVKHERKTKTSTTKLDDPRDIYETVANQGARRVRSCILAIIPGDVVEAAVEQCKRTLVSGNTKPLSDRIRDMIVAFDKGYQVSKAMLEKYIGCNSDAFSENDFVRLSNVYRSLKDGMAKREDYFDVRAAGNDDAASSKLEQEFKGKKTGGEAKDEPSKS
ncbi:hypothetical protein [Paenibacillus sp. RC84]|uniref:hypothetical protein n=1 Tax=Paenibacillus sp. RC84 TaxID=3156252 RepID=UPI003516C489